MTDAISGGSGEVGPSGTEIRRRQVLMLKRGKKTRWRNGGEKHRESRTTSVTKGNGASLASGRGTSNIPD